MYSAPDGFCLLHWVYPPLVIPAKAGTQEAVETKRFFYAKDELSQKGLKWAAFLRNALFVLGSCFRRNDEER
jgi:hypothetical protein